MYNLTIRDVIYIHLNQNWREGEVLAVIDDRMLIEYEMPSGVTFLIFMPNPCKEYDRNSARMETKQLRTNNIWNQKISWDRHKSISYNALPKKWLNEIIKNELNWFGGHVEEFNPSPTERLKMKEKKT